MLLECLLELIKIVDILEIAYFWSILIFYESPFSTLSFLHTYINNTNNPLQLHPKPPLIHVCARSVQMLCEKNHGTTLAFTSFNN